MSDEILYSFPLSRPVLEGVAKRVNAANQASRDEIIAAWCPTTGFVLSVHVAGGLPFYFENLGPLTETQADSWAHGLSEVGSTVRVLM